jgi:hypothetical protein
VTCRATVNLRGEQRRPPLETSAYSAGSIGWPTIEGPARGLVRESSLPLFDLGANLVEQLLKLRIRLGLDFNGDALQLLARVLGGFPRAQANGQTVRRPDRVKSLGSLATIHMRLISISHALHGRSRPADRLDLLYTTRNGEVPPYCKVR